MCVALQHEEPHATPSPRRSPVPMLDRLVPERSSKRSTHSLDLNANENGASEQSGSESVEEGEESPHPGLIPPAVRLLVH